MVNVSSVKISVPTKTAGEIIRKELASAILSSQKKLTYIHAGAGYGKTTLLAQVSNSVESAVWLTLDGESDVFSFLDLLSEAIHYTFPCQELNFSQYLPFEGKNNFITILANGLISSIENIAQDCMIVIDDLHTIQDNSIKDFITCLIKYKPENIRICVGSRETPWKEFVPLQARGNIFELTQKELAFTREEATHVLGFEDENIYAVTEGWPLGINSFKVLCENGVDFVDILTQGNDILDSYLFYECTSCLPDETIDFLKTSACFEELDPKMLDAVTNKKNSLLHLDSLVKRNIFTTKTKGEQFRYHTLFRKHLLKDMDVSEQKELEHKAGLYYYELRQYSQAAKYAILAHNNELLEKIILASYEDHIKNGSFSELRNWLKALGYIPATSSQKFSLVRGIFLSSIGNFSEAKTWLDNVKPKEDKAGEDLYFDAMVHKARILRNSASFEESNELLDSLLVNINSLVPDRLYQAGIEKIYNLCWNSQIKEAYDTVYLMIETCARVGNVKVKAWFERYLTAVHFFAGRMKDTVYYYEKSLELSEQERLYLDMHSIGMFAAKAYQMLGEREKALTIIGTEIQKLRSTGRYEELWAAYLLAAEIYYHIADMDRRNGNSPSYNSSIKYFALGIEYASLYRTSEFQLAWAKTQRLVYSLIFTNDTKATVIDELLSSLENIGDYLKTIVLGRLFGYYISVSDLPNAVKYAKMAIEIGERSNIMMIPTIAYGLLTGAAISAKDYAKAGRLAARYLKLCSENGIYDYFKILGLYGSILQFALDHGIESDFSKKMMAFAGYKTKKVYIRTFGGLDIYPYQDRQKPFKMRSKKERELFAFLLDTGSLGVTKEQIYEAIWSETESDNVKKLIGVNLAHIKKDLASLGIKDIIINHQNHYRICRDEIECDYELLEEAAEKFRLQHSNEVAQIILSLYKGEYLADFEAFWATGKKIRYREIYEQALEFITQGHITQGDGSLVL
jgi:LuxR family maltose regulon positive regulatory protein